MFQNVGRKIQGLAEILFFLFLTFCFSGCSDTEDSPSASGVTSAVSSSVLSSIPVQVGDVITTDDLIFTLLGTEGTAFVEDYEPAPYGEEFFFIAFEVENISTEEKTISGSDFKFYCNNEELPTTSFSLYKYLGIDSFLIAQNVAAGRKTSFYFAVKIPENCDNVEILYKDSYTFNITHAPVTYPSGNASTSANADSSDNTLPDTPPRLSIGETLTNSAFEITLLQAIQTDYVADYGSYYYSPDEGKHFVIFFMDVKNISSKAMRFNYLSHFDAYADDYATQFTGFWGTDINGHDALGDLDYTDILPDKSIAGYCVLEVPDGWNTIELSARNGTFVISANEAEIQ